MNEVSFIWDENKNELNKKKHGISFEEVTEVFGDENAILFDDPDHSYEEERFLIIGITGAKGIWQQRKRKIFIRKVGKNDER